MRPVVLCMLLVLAGCAKPLTGDEPTSCDVGLSGPKLTYLGVGGWLLRWEKQALMFAPSFSNPAFPPLFVSPDQRRIADAMPAASDVTVILIGHSHYDHLLDVPYVMQAIAPKALAFGTANTGHILAAAGLKPRFRDVGHCVVAVERRGRAHPAIEPGKWIRHGRFRFMAIQSEHAPHFAGIDFLGGGSYDKDLKRLPKRARGWPSGPILAWLVDVLDDADRPVYRLHYQDSASNPPYGFPPILQDGKAIDVSIISGASVDQVALYPDALLEVARPRRLLIGHWEDFFANDLKGEPRLLRGQNQAKLLSRLKQDFSELKPVMPYPLTDVALPAPEPGPPIDNTRRCDMSLSAQTPDFK